LPDWYAKQPPIYRGDDFYLSGFTMLATERSFPGDGFGPIPWSKAWDYAARQGLDRDMCNFFAQVILLLDGFYREHVRTEQGKEADRQKRKDRRAKARDGSAHGKRGRRTKGRK
jgi:hypothetical protein